MPAWVSSPVHSAVVSALIQARKDAGLTQRDVSARIGKPPSFIAKIELRERNLSVLEFIGIAKAIGVNPHAVLSQVERAIPDKFLI